MTEDGPLFGKYAPDTEPPRLVDCPAGPLILVKCWDGCIPVKDEVLIADCERRGLAWTYSVKEWLAVLEALPIAGGWRAIVGHREQLPSSLQVFWGRAWPWPWFDAGIAERNARSMANKAKSGSVRSVLKAMYPELAA